MGEIRKEEKGREGGRETGGRKEREMCIWEQASEGKDVVLMLS